VFLSQEIGHHILQRLDFIKVSPQKVLNLSKNTSYFAKALSKRYPKAKIFEHFPEKKQSIDLIFSHLVLHAYPDLLSEFQKIRHFLKIEGVFLFSMLGQNTLIELRDKWEIPSFKDMHHVGDFLLQAGFQDPVVDMETVQLQFNTLDDLSLELENMQEHFFCSSIDSIEREKPLTITFEIIYGYAISKFLLHS
jgi:malonyl-CoA O-methyltransferase